MPPPSPEAAHVVRVDGQDIPYRLRRSARRTIGLTIDAHGLRIAAPRAARLSAIESAIHSHARWVIDKLAAWRERPAPAEFAVHDGMTLAVAGQILSVHVDPARQRGHRLDRGLRQLFLNGRQAPLDALRAALQAEARQLFAERLAVYAAQLGVPTPPLRLSSARTRWGSCNARGGISLNWRLMLFPLHLIDYVVAHELAHLREMNHSPRFWAVVETLCPAWRQCRRELREQARGLPAL